MHIEVSIRLGALQDTKQLFAAYPHLVERFTNLSLFQAALLDNSQGRQYAGCLLAEFRSKT